MAAIGLNHKVHVATGLRAETRSLYGSTLGATMTSPAPPIDVFTFADGANIGVFYVEPSEALSPVEMRRALWLEIEVDDPAATSKALAKLGIHPFEYVDKEHEYFQAPGGQTFRLARTRQR
jgi:hypothetical protein